jgi:hypothetical protein
LLHYSRKGNNRLEDQRQEIPRKKQQDSDELDTIVAELEKYRKEILLIKRVKELEAKLDEANKLIEYYETYIIGLARN